jgi:hypothetical protein
MVVDSVDNLIINDENLPHMTLRYLTNIDELR